MLQQFLADNRLELTARCRAKVAGRSHAEAEAASDEHGIPVFLDQLIGALRSARPRDFPEMERTATRHGAELFRQDVTIDQVVHSYGDLCQAIMELAMEKGARIQVAEFALLNQALDNAIADAVTEYSCGSSSLLVERGLRAENERLGLLAHELRNQVHTATLALAAIKAGNVGLFGATGSLLDRTMNKLRALVDRSLMEVRLRSPLGTQRTLLPLAAFLQSAAATAALEARAADCELTVGEVNPELAIDGDEDVLLSALGNLLQNAIKFSHKPGEVSLHAHAEGERILIEVADSCGGLPAGKADQIFEPFVQAGTDRTGLGLGLAIVRRSVVAHDGALTVRDVPPMGCVFTIDLPRRARGP